MSPPRGAGVSDSGTFLQIGRVLLVGRLATLAILAPMLTLSVLMIWWLT